VRTLTLIPRQGRIEYAGFAGGETVIEGAKRLRDRHPDDAALRRMVSGVLKEFRRVMEATPEVVAVRGPFGGPEFAGPVVFTDDAARRLQAQAVHAPLHVPALLRLAQACARVFAGAKVVLVFETSFFVALPEREYAYGLGPEGMYAADLRRYGFHGVFHEAACRFMARNAREAGRSAPQRILSIVLEPKPEVSAVLGLQPLTVTSGATPLEGIPGETSGGELDAGIVLGLSREKGWGPEQINSVLSRESGIKGLTGRRLTLEDLFHSKSPATEPAREVLRYRLLLACGAGVAAMSGLDGIVFSGRYAALGEQLGPWLQSRIRLSGDSEGGAAWKVFDVPLHRLVAEAAITAALSDGCERRVEPETVSAT